MKFRICWYECHNPINWINNDVGDFCDEYYEKLKKLREIKTAHKPLYNKLYTKIENLLLNLEEKSGIQEIIETLPTKSWQYDSDDNWIGVECEDTFEANSIEEAKKYVEENYDVEVFSVWQEPNYTEPVFTEEDLEAVI